MSTMMAHAVMAAVVIAVVAIVVAVAVPVAVAVAVAVTVASVMTSVMTSVVLEVVVGPVDDGLPGWIHRLHVLLLLKLLLLHLLILLKLVGRLGSSSCLGLRVVLRLGLLVLDSGESIVNLTYRLSHGNVRILRLLFGHNFNYKFD